MFGLGVIAGIAVVGLLWRHRPRDLPDPNTAVYRNRFGVKFGEMSREQVEAAMRGMETRKSP